MRSFLLLVRAELLFWYLDCLQFVKVFVRWSVVQLWCLSVTLISQTAIPVRAEQCEVTDTLVASRTAKKYKNKRKQPALLIPQRWNDWPPQALWELVGSIPCPRSCYQLDFRLLNPQLGMETKTFWPPAQSPTGWATVAQFSCFCPNKKNQRPLKCSKFIPFVIDCATHVILKFELTFKTWVATDARPSLFPTLYHRVYTDK